MTAERKKLIALGVLVLVGGYFVWSNLLSNSSSDSTAGRAPQVAPVAVVIHPATDLDPAAVRRREGLNRSAEFNPSWKDPKNPVDPLKVDPTIRLDLLAKVQHVAVESVGLRNLFQFGEASKPVVADAPMPKVKQIAVRGPMGPFPLPKPAPAIVASKPPPPPINLKYYGYSTPRLTAQKRAFFLDGEDIIVATEGELIKRRYKVVKIGVNSVTMEDTEFKDQQTIPLAPDAVT